MLTILLAHTLSWFQLDPEVKAKVVGAFKNIDRFELRFKQETYSDFFDETVAEGILKVWRPGRMRMEYLKGERRLFIWDGTTCYEKDFLADTESRAAQADVRNEPLVQLLLYGSDLDRLFLIDRYQQNGKSIFRLQPRDSDDYQVEVSFNKDWLPSYMEVFSSDGEGTRFWFQDYNLAPNFQPDQFKAPEPAPSPQP